MKQSVQNDTSLSKILGVFFINVIYTFILQILVLLKKTLTWNIIQPDKLKTKMLNLVTAKFNVYIVTDMLKKSDPTIKL